MQVRLGELARVLKKHRGAQLVKPNGSSHWKLVGANGTYPIPARNGEKTEVKKEYLRAALKFFDMTIEELKTLL